MSIQTLLQVVWSAWLSTLGHAPSVMDLADSQNVHQFTDTASLMVDKFVPVSFQVCLLPMSVIINPCYHWLLLNYMGVSRSVSVRLLSFAGITVRMFQVGGCGGVYARRGRVYMLSALSDEAVSSSATT